MQPENWGALKSFGEALLLWAETGVDSGLSMSDAETRVGMRMLWDKNHDDSKLSAPDQQVAARLRERWARGPRKFGGTTLTVETVAKCLIAVAEGADAREVFRQTRGDGRQSLSWYRTTIALRYWWTRAEGNTHKRALAAAQAQAEAIGQRFGLPPLKASSLLRYCRDLRDYALAIMDTADNAPDTAHLRAELARRSKQGNWDTPLPEAD